MCNSMAEKAYVLKAFRKNSEGSTLETWSSDKGTIHTSLCVCTERCSHGAFPKILKTLTSYS